jgi:hypothetical protein
MRFNYDYPDFVNVIRNNPEFSFLSAPERFYRDSDHGCSCYARVPGASATVYFHNFDLNTSYHVQVSVIERMVTAFNLFKHKDLIKGYFENSLKMKFKQEVYDAIQAGYDEYSKQIENYIKFRGGKYRTVQSVNLRICFDKETHEYLGYSMNIHTHLIYHKKKGNLSPIIHFEVDGHKDEITYEVRYPFFTNRNISRRVYVNSIPEEASVMQHWVARCDGPDESTFEEAMDGIDRIEMAVTIKEMIAI